MPFRYDVFEALCAEMGKAPTTAAQEAGIARNQPAKWKTGQHAPNPKSLFKLAKYFDVSVDFLCGESSINESKDISGIKNSVVLQNTTGNNTVSNGDMRTDAGSTTQLTDQEQEMLRIFRSLDMRNKNKALTFLYDLEDEAKK